MPNVFMFVICSCIRIKSEVSRELNRLKPLTPFRVCPICCLVVFGGPVCHCVILVREGVSWLLGFALVSLV